MHIALFVMYFLVPLLYILRSAMFPKRAISMPYRNLAVCDGKKWFVLLIKYFSLKAAPRVWCISRTFQFRNDSCLQLHEKLWMWNWRMDACHEDWWLRGIYFALIGSFWTSLFHIATTHTHTHNEALSILFSVLKYIVIHVIAICVSRPAYGVASDMPRHSLHCQSKELRSRVDINLVKFRSWFSWNWAYKGGSATKIIELLHPFLFWMTIRSLPKRFWKLT